MLATPHTENLILLVFAVCGAIADSYYKTRGGKRAPKWAALKLAAVFGLLLVYWVAWCIRRFDYLPDCDILCLRFCWLRSLEMVRSPEKSGAEVEIMCGRNIVGEN